MKNVSRSLPARSSRCLGFLLAALALAPAGAIAAKDDFPRLKQGEWEFVRKSANAPKGAQDLAVKECLDPAASMREQNAIMAKAGCTFDPAKIEGKSYTYVARCDIPNMGKSVSRSVLTYESDSAYSVAVESEGEMNGKPMKISETLIARRVGSCKKQ
ncbi:MAG: DUF3617 family protein [Burkholderiales bacterium]